MFFNNSFSELYSARPWFVILISTILIITLLINLFKKVRQWNYNNGQPVLTFDAVVVSKKIDVTRGIRKTVHNKDTDTALSRYAQTVKYYVTFQVENGECITFRVKLKDYNRLIERSLGKITYQGTRYLRFVKRDIEKHNDWQFKN